MLKESLNQQLNEENISLLEKKNENLSKNDKALNNNQEAEEKCFKRLLSGTEKLSLNLG